MEAGKTAYRCRCGREIEEARPGETVTCPDCGIKFAIEDGCAKFKILPEISEDEFVRAAWVYLAKSDVPLDVFKCDLSTVETVEHCIAVDTQKANASYKAVTSYVNNESVVSDCVVYSTAYAECGKEEPVRVASVEEDGMCLGEEDEKPQVAICFDLDEFLNCLEKAKIDSFVPPEPGEREKMDITQDSRWAMDKRHEEDIKKAVEDALSDVEYRYLEHDDVVLERSTQIFSVLEYRVAVIYDGRTYTLTAFPFGSGEVRGGEIENKIGLKAIKKEKEDKLENETKQIRASSRKEKWQEIGPLIILACVLWGLFVFGSVAFMPLGEAGDVPIETFFSWVVPAPFFVAAVAISIVNGVKAYGIVKRTGLGVTSLMHTEKEEWRAVKKLTIAAAVLWCIVLASELVLLSVTSGYVLSRNVGVSWNHNRDTIINTTTISLLVLLLVDFVAAVLVSAINKVRGDKISKNIDSTVSDMIKAKDEAFRSDMEAFAESHYNELFDALNAKLASLGMGPAETSDLEQSDLES